MSLCTLMRICTLCKLFLQEKIVVITIPATYFVMAARPTPFIDINNNQEATYHSFDAIDQGTYDALNFRYERNAFLQVVRQWLNAVAEGCE